MTVDVVIAGGGPNGLMLAAELGLAGIRSVVLESLPEPSQEPKANGLLGQVVRLVDHRGLHEPLTGSPEPPRPNNGYFMFAALPLDLSGLSPSPVHNLPAPQQKIVGVLTDRAAELGAEIRWGHRITGLTQDEDGVTVEVDGPEGGYQLTARYLVGADGAHSVVRKLLGIGFPGLAQDRATSRTAHAEVPADWVDAATGALHVPGFGVVRPFLPVRTEHGGFSYAPLPGQPAIVSTAEWDQPPAEDPMTLAELQASARRVLGADLPLRPAPGGTLLRRLPGSHTRVADRYRQGRVFLVGDAAHVFAAGGQGLNIGLTDAVNLGWKLAAALRGQAPPGLLDSYESERRPAALRVSLLSQAQSALLAPGAEVTALRELFGELLGHPSTVRHLAELIAGSDIRYDTGDTHPLSGRFVPDLDLDGPRVAELARTGRPLLLNLTGDEDPALIPQWTDRVDVITARCPNAPAALLIRPDGYVAWAADELDPVARQALSAALTRWVGEARR
ncbi:FAD-dependent monooxygenase [Crossiella sp. CA-258035]|uniref:FAD-dependent monooxygenase n=1 Tax=Crossiella sp. CA-258035 TaxID=2981138 RepID=UPI0024BC740B|nr:FAD-dependent monooxygenase [Crossiella sp. CA-258035]WHT22477.1 FAD-dependent monooxygenase [Crossiella sp. CA-258035]